MIEANTGDPLSIGAAIFMIEAMLHPSTSQHLGLGFFRHLSLARNDAARRLSEITGTASCFPAATDSGDIVDGAGVGEAPPATPEPPRPAKAAVLKLWRGRPRGLLYRFVTGALSRPRTSGYAAAIPPLPGCGSGIPKVCSPTQAGTARKQRDRRLNRLATLARKDRRGASFPGGSA
jgi:hypothetical protein